MRVFLPAALAVLLVPLAGGCGSVGPLKADSSTTQDSSPMDTAAMDTAAETPGPTDTAAEARDAAPDAGDATSPQDAPVDVRDAGPDQTPGDTASPTSLWDDPGARWDTSLWN